MKVKKPCWKPKRYRDQFYLYTQPSDKWGHNIWELDWVKIDGWGVSNYWCLEYAEGLYSYRAFDITQANVTMAKRWAEKTIQENHPNLYGATQS